MFFTWKNRALEIRAMNPLRVQTDRGHRLFVGLLILLVVIIGNVFRIF